MPFARFQVERTLEGARDDEALGEVASVIRALPPGSCATSSSSSPPAGSGSAPSSWRARSARAARAGRARRRERRSARPANGARQALDRREQSERAFLALCVALPELGEEKLGALDLDAVFSSPQTRRAAELLRGHLASPVGRSSARTPS